MTVTSPPPVDPAAADPGSGGRVRGALVVAALTVVVLGSVALWAYALWGPRVDPPGTMDDPAWGESAEVVCARTLTAIEALPFPFQSPTPAERGEVVATANAELDTMLDELATIEPTTAEDRRRTEEWIADWRTYLGDRERYADGLQAGDDPRFTETAKGGDHISQALEFFADINGMPSCAPPGDVG